MTPLTLKEEAKTHRIKANFKKKHKEKHIKSNKINITHILSMGRAHLPKWLIFYGFHVGKYTVRPMDGMGIKRKASK